MSAPTNDEIKKSIYFSNRNVSEEAYSHYSFAKHLEPYFPENAREMDVLDIGCGLGQFLKSLRDKQFENLYGIDINDEAVAAGKRNNINVEKIEDIRAYAKGASKKFDRIIMSHVLEHIDKEAIIDTLIHIRQYLLKKDGIFLLMVPNAQSYTGAYWRYEDFTHTIMFTAGSCLYALKSAGFTTIDFIDPDGTQYINPLKRGIIKILLGYHRLKENIWNKVLQTSFHKPSPRIYSFELKIAASN